MAIRKVRLALKNNRSLQASDADGGALFNNSSASGGMSQVGSTESAQILYQENTLPHEHGTRSANLIETGLDYSMGDRLGQDDVLHAEIAIDVNKNPGVVLLDINSEDRGEMYMRPDFFSSGNLRPLVKFMTYEHDPALFLHKRTTLFQNRTMVLSTADDRLEVPISGDATDPSTYVGNGVVELDFLNESLVYTEFTGMDLDVVRPLGITSSSNYLIVFNADTVYWSNPILFSDFTPAVGGAGSSKIAEARGSIITIIPSYNGMIVYCTENIISMTFSGDTENPWIFREVPNSAGLSLGDSFVQVVPLVASNEQQQMQYAMLTTGLHAVTETGALKLPDSINEYISNPYVTVKDAGKSTIRQEAVRDVNFPFSKLQYIHSYGSNLFLFIGDIMPSYRNRLLIWDIRTQTFSTIKGNWRTMHKTVTTDQLTNNDLLNAKPRIVPNSYVLIENNGSSANLAYYLGLATRSQATDTPDRGDAEILLGNIQLDEDKYTILHSVAFNFNDEYENVRVFAFDVETQLADEGIEFIYNPADKKYYGYIEGRNIKLLLTGTNFYLSVVELELENGGIY